MKSFLLIFFFSTALHAEIILPSDPGKENDKTLMGIDSNNNNVRDDLEIFIYKEITKDEKLFRAYLNHTESELMMIKYSDDLEKLRFYLKQKRNDVECISSLVKRVNLYPQEFSKRIYNTPERIRVGKKIEQKHNQFSSAHQLIRKEERHLKCR